ncbi:MAG: metal-dependent hydrolase [Gemmatimonadetes bacterium]|nr:MAG: metal-dependent hydrolase [Gemmatimonadota bacterium]
MARIDYVGHATFFLTTDDGTRIAVDPFYDENPLTDLTVESVGHVDYVFVTHGHFDHFADAIPLARRTGATLVGTFEIVSFAQTKGIENAHPMHIGGSWRFPFGRVKLTPAIHGGSVAGDDAGAYSTFPAGLLFDLGDGQRVYDAGDTALTMDMQLLRGQVDVALLPIGDNFTMGPEDAARAVEFIEPKVVVPIHYGTWPFVDTDPDAFARLVGERARVEIVRPGESFEF